MENLPPQMMLKLSERLHWVLEKRNTIRRFAGWQTTLSVAAESSPLSLSRRAKEWPAFDKKRNASGEIILNDSM
jgi:hypothetical protein